MNLFPADLAEGGVKFGSAVAKVDRDTLGNAKGKKVTIGVRPEDLKVDTKGDGLKVDVDVVEELGADGYLYGHTEIDGKRVDIVVRVDGRIAPERRRQDRHHAGARGTCTRSTPRPASA